MSILPRSLSRQERRAAIKRLERDNAASPATMTPVPQPWPAPYLQTCVDTVIGLWRSRRFLAQLYRQKDGSLRLSVNRTSVDPAGDRWLDGITWDELQQVKAECGFGDHWAAEIYPPAADLVNVANVRHLFLLPEAPAFAWKRDT
jgi:hypothetical protein